MALMVSISLKSLGFLISDYDAIGKVASQGLPTTGVKMELKQAYLMSLSAGMDMFMQSPHDDYEVYRYFGFVKELISEGLLRESRINDMVRRILAVKLAMQLVVVPDAIATKYNYKNPTQQQETSGVSNDEYADALKAAQESLVLLKNTNDVVPLKKANLKYIILVGEKGLLVDGKWTNLLGYDNIGMQNGGWSVR
jgi:beta-glucosidase